MTTHEIPEQCDATARCMGALLVCDRERGHEGPHRSYWPEIDEPMFWNNRPGVAGYSPIGDPRGAPTTRRR